jgi:hypothetical protein
MKNLLVILLVIFCQDIFCQQQIRFETGDFIIWSHGPLEDPRTYSVDRENDLEGLVALTDTINQYGDAYLITMIDPTREDLFSIRTEGDTQYVQAIQDVYGGVNFAYNQDHDMQPFYQDGKIVFLQGTYLEIPTRWFPHAKNIWIKSHRRVIVLFTRNPYTKKI